MHTKDIAYEIDGATYKGYLARDDSTKGSRPGILVCHQGNGLAEGDRTHDVPFGKCQAAA